MWLDITELHKQSLKELVRHLIHDGETRLNRQRKSQ
jgi:hypothetical protein